MNNLIKNKLYFLGYSLLAFLTLFIYWPGLHSIFLLDDGPNLSTIGDHLSLGYWHNVLIFLLEGRSGPTGRPLSLLSFFLNSSTYPADPWSFKLLNVIIHIINGALISLLLYKVTQLINMKKRLAQWLILLATAFWLLHPFQITTVLYVIQRMTELSALFILLGLLGYLYGREWLTNISNTNTHFQHVLLLTLIIWSCLTLAMLSKETGILLLAYILVIEYFLLRPYQVKTSKMLKNWLFVAVLIPSISILGYVYWGAFSSHAFDSRPFTLEQRLLTETRIIFDYLTNIVLPGFSTPTLFHDDYSISTGWLQPWTTLSSTISLLLLVSIAWLMRTKHTIISFGILWFLASHLLESTVLPLELYFEHRNYLAMLGPLLIIIYTVQQLALYQPKLKKIAYVFVGIFSLLLATNTLQNTILWSNPLALISVWVKDHPNSTRALSTLDGFEKASNATLMDQEIRKIIASLNNAEKHPRPFFLLIRQLAHDCNNHVLTTKKLQAIQSQLAHTSNELASAKVLHQFIKNWQAGQCQNISAQQMIVFLETLLTVPKADIGTLKHVAYFGLSEVWKTEKNLDKTIFYLTKSYEKAPSLGLLLAKVEYFISAGLYNEANATLNDLSLLKTTLRKRLVLTLRKKEIEAVKNRIQQYQQLSKS